jgi:hypothetical protein
VFVIKIIKTEKIVSKNKRKPNLSIQMTLFSILKLRIESFGKSIKFFKKTKVRIKEFIVTEKLVISKIIDKKRISKNILLIIKEL